MYTTLNVNAMQGCIIISLKILLITIYFFFIYSIQIQNTLCLNVLHKKKKTISIPNIISTTYIGEPFQERKIGDQY